MYDYVFNVNLAPLVSEITEARSLTFSISSGLNKYLSHIRSIIHLFLSYLCTSWLFASFHCHMKFYHEHLYSYIFGMFSIMCLDKFLEIGSLILLWDAHYQGFCYSVVVCRIATIILFSLCISKPLIHQKVRSPSLIFEWLALTIRMWWKEDCQIEYRMPSKVKMSNKKKN